MARFLDRLADILSFEPGASGIVEAAASPVRVSRAAGVVAGLPPWGFGPPLQPFDVEAVAGWVMTRDVAMTLPTISRAQTLLCGLIAQLPFTQWRVDYGAVPPVEARTPAVSWTRRPDPDRTRAWILGWTADDLMFDGVAHWRVTSRFADTYPATFRRIPPGGLDLRADHAQVTDPDYNEGQPERVALADIVQFQSPVEGLLANGGRAISIALQLDGAADRFASVDLPTGILEEQDGSEDLTSDELAKLAESFTMARRLNTTAATNKYVRYRETPVDASQMQLVEGRTYQALELARLANVPPYLVGAPAGTGMTYLNGQQARQDLVDFAAAPIVACIEQTLSGPNVLPAGNSVRLDLNVWLRNPFTTGATGEPSPNDMQIAGDTQTLPAPPLTEVAQ